MLKQFCQDLTSNIFKTESAQCLSSRWHKLFKTIEV